MTKDQDRSPWVGEQPAWDEEAAAQLRDARVLIGITYLSATGEVEELVQMHGRIAIVDAERGVGIALEGPRAGETYWLPPMSDAFAPAAPGEYHLKSTGEVVIDPDYTSSWTITRPAKT